jgi:long-chain fatty acid transport protein
MRLSMTLSALVLALTAAAANGQDGGASVIERGTPDMGLSGAGNSARADDAGTAHFNAAGMTRLKQREIMGGMVGMFPSLSIDLDSGTRSTPRGNRDGGGSAGSTTVLGGMYLALPLDDDLWFGFTFNGPYGGAVNYRNQWAGRTFVQEASLVGLNFEPALGYRLDEHWSVGASFSALYADLEVKFKLAAPSNSPRVKIEDADDWGYGYSASVLYEFDEDTRVGARYRSKIDLDLSGDFSVPKSSVDFDDQMEMPQSIAIGGYHGLDQRWALLGDVSWTEWSKFAYSPATIASAGTLPIDRDWEDTWRVGAGVQFAWSEKTTLRSGVSWTEDPVSDRRRLPDIPVAETWRFSVGLETDVTENTTLGLSYTLAWMKDMDLDHVELPPQFKTSLNGEYDDSTIHFIGVTLRYRF